MDIAHPHASFTALVGLRRASFVTVTMLRSMASGPLLVVSRGTIWTPMMSPLSIAVICAHFRTPDEWGDKSCADSLWRFPRQHAGGPTAGTEDVDENNKAVSKLL